MDVFKTTRAFQLCYENGYRATNGHSESSALTHKCLRVHGEIVVWIYNILDKNCKVLNNFIKCLNDSY